MIEKNIGHSEGSVCLESVKHAHSKNNELGLLFGPWRQKRNIQRGPGALGYSWKVVLSDG